MRLLADVSAHGFGHMMQTTCVLDALAARVPNLQVTLRTDVPERAVRRFWPAGATLVPGPFDPSLAMSAPDTVDVDATAALYRDFPARFEAAVRESDAVIARLRPDAVFADIAAPGLVAARRAGIPALALCSLNWAGVLRATLPQGAVDKAAIRCFDTAYAAADAFLMPEPSMAMPSLGNSRTIGPIGRIGRNRQAEIRALIGGSIDKPIGLVSWGGWTTGVAADFLSGLPDEIDWITDPEPLLQAGMTHIDLMASSAIVIAKPGYGTFVETVANRARLLHTPREGWPETPALTAWANRHGRAAGLPAHASPDEAATLIRRLMAETPPAPPALTGADEAADCLLDLVAGRDARAATA